MSPFYIFASSIFAAKSFFKKRQKSPLASFYGILETTHYLPGRLRLRLPTLVQQEAEFNKLRESLLTVSPIEAVDYNVYSGSLLINYKEDDIKPELLQGVVIRLAQLDTLMQGERQACLSDSVKSSSKVINDSIYDLTRGALDTKTLLFLFLAYKAASTYSLEKSLGIIPPIQYAWMAYGCLD